MGHRHLFGTSQMFEGDNEQSWNTMHVEQPYGHLARGSAVENGGFFYPMENMPTDGPPFTSCWEPVPRSNGYVPLAHNGELSHHQQDPPGLSQDYYTHPSNIGTFSAFPENYAHHAPSSSYDTQIYYGVDGNPIDMMIDNGRGQHKRKSPGIPAVSERGSSSRYHGGGNASSSDVPVSSELRLEKSPIDSAHMPWDSIDSTPDYRANNHPTRGESSLRNVRSRSGVDLEPNISRNYMSTTPPLNTYNTNHPMEHPSQMDLPGETSSTMPREWSLADLSSGHTRVPLSDAGGYNHEPNHFPCGSSNATAPVENVVYDFVSNRNHVVHQGFHGSSSQHSIRHARGAYSQRSNLAFRSSGNGIRMGNMGHSEERPRSATASFSRHSRPLASMGWRNNERNRRSRISHERYRPVPDDAGGHGQLAYEGLVIMDRSTLYASRSGFDQHGDLRLDIDNMSYEELLALGERIGNVSTGLSEDSISKCLKETVHCSSDQIQEEERCAICLEEYKDMEDVGLLKTCGHDYHVNCIKKWLSMKNLCPICKSPALGDDMKQQ